MCVKVALLLDKQLSLAFFCSIGIYLHDSLLCYNRRHLCVGWLRQTGDCSPAFPGATGGSWIYPHLSPLKVFLKQSCCSDFCD